MKLDHNLVVLITGGASGLGEQTMRHLVSFGCKVAIADMNEDRINELGNEFKDKIITFICDVTVEEDVKKAVDGTVKHWGKLSVAIACAGFAKSFYALVLPGQCLH